MSEKLSWKESCEEQVEQFKGRISKFTSLKLELRINNNRSTMLALLEKRRGAARLSLHRMFLEAPDPVLMAIAHYVHGGRRRGEDYHRVLRSYIQTHLPQQDYSNRLNPDQLKRQGRVYDLEAIYHEVNKKYFDGKLNLKITWYGRTMRSKRPRRITYGLFEDALKLIKIHRILDDPFFPPYFVSYVVYHEMLHAIVPGEMDARGNFCVHTRLFKEKEKLFADYKRALAWEKQHCNQIFCHGRT